MGSNPCIIRRYFDLLEMKVEQNDLLKKPAQIFNLDETDMPLDPATPQVVAGRGIKNPSAPSSGDRPNHSSGLL